MTQGVKSAGGGNRECRRGGARSAGEERHATRLIFQVSECRRDGIGDDVQVGGGAGV